ncbi:hypothetical protein PRIPAC_95091, partial [Pristionchus pacificus]
FFSNPLTPLPDWLIAREHIGTVFFRLHSVYLPELIKATNIFIPFRPIHPLPNRDESQIALERRSHFTTIGFFHAVCDAVDANFSSYSDDPSVMQMISRELPRLRAILGAIQCIVWSESSEPFESHYTAPSEEFTRPALHNIEDSLQYLDLEQLAVSITLLGGWETAKLAVEAHFQLKFPSLPRSFGFPSAEELAPLPCVENLVENEAVRVLEESLAQMKMEKRESSTSSECESGTSYLKKDGRAKWWKTIRQRDEKKRARSRKTQKKELDSNGVLAASLEEFSRLSSTVSSSQNKSRSGSRNERSIKKLAPIGSKCVWEEKGKELRQIWSSDECDSIPSSHSFPSSSSSSFHPPMNSNGLLSEDPL